MARGREEASYGREVGVDMRAKLKAVSILTDSITTSQFAWHYEKIMMQLIYADATFNVQLNDAEKEELFTLADKVLARSVSEMADKMTNERFNQRD